MLDLNKLNIRGKEIIFYPYRQAMVYGIIEMKPNNEEYINLIEDLCEVSSKIYRNGNIQEISETNNAYPDNHICFSIGEDMAIMFSDGEIRIGNDIKIGNW